tara:strand:+ start:142 stop:411 length:270 start_codon:yes stop_codon:yes gene_type:complete
MVTKEIELGDLVRIYQDFRYTKPISGSHECSHGTGLVVGIEDKRGSFKKRTDKEKPILSWQEYTVLWSETGKKTKHFIGQLTKINGEEI